MKKEIIKYDDEFKRTVVNMLESGELSSMEQARKIFKIGGAMSVKNFIKQLHREDLLPKLRIRRMKTEAERFKDSDPVFYEKIIKNME